MIDIHSHTFIDNVISENVFPPYCFHIYISNEINEENSFCIYKPLGNWKQRVELKETAYVSLEVQSVNKESVEHNKRANKLLKLTLVWSSNFEQCAWS